MLNSKFFKYLFQHIKNKKEYISSKYRTKKIQYQFKVILNPLKYLKIYIKSQINENIILSENKESVNFNECYKYEQIGKKRDLIKVIETLEKIIKIKA